VEPEYNLINMDIPVVAVPDINPHATVLLDLTKSEERLLAEMHPKTRYNIHLAGKKDLKIENIKDCKILLDLMKSAGKKDGFHLHPENHYQRVLESAISTQLVVYWQNQPIATAVFIGFGDTFTYLFGAADYDTRYLKAACLLQWRGIQLGKQFGHKYYDFFGIAPGARNQAGDYNYDDRHKYAGITKFKMGFGGEVVVSPGTFDLVLNKYWYKIYCALRRLRRLV